MSTLSEVILCGSLLAIAAVHVLRFAAWYRQDPPVEDDDDEEPPPAPRPRRFPDLFVPLSCGLATTHAGLTGSCCRRRNHLPPCLTEEAIEHIATHGPVTTLEPLARPDEVEWGKTQA